VGSAPGFQVVTVATRAAAPSGWGHLEVLENSARRCGLELTVLGLGKRWTGSAMRLLLLADHLAGVPDDEVYLFVDAYDVVLLPNAVELGRRFRAMDAPVVFGAERVCWPFPELARSYPPAPLLSPWKGSPRSLVRPPPPLRTPFRYLNAGGYIGYAGAIRSVIGELSFKGTESDQGLFTRYYLERGRRLRLDHSATLFQALHAAPADELFFTEGPPWTLRNRWLGSDPCLLHGNGAGRRMFLHMLSRLRARGWP
jgi:hypothetical protein